MFALRKQWITTQIDLNYIVRDTVELPAYVVWLKPTVVLIYKIGRKLEAIVNY